ncbi:farnesyl pyrophosphate synthase-like [Photinus pyralis]|uniref:farnesyl pyrophosphate synthase-like n=1 Tax=Photinus pyralis TaxID=7054 RepID=UPI001267417E|nr:farnesyl pyrophosphate synthase-like [Photinus pyralis]
MVSRICRRFCYKSALSIAHADKMCDQTHLTDKPDDFQELTNVKKMMHQFPFVVRDSILRTDPEMRGVVERYDELCYYTGPERDLYPGPVLMDCYTALESPEKLTCDRLKMATMLSWAFEHAATCILIVDDVMDESVERWKKPTWHTLPEVGMRVALDVNLIRMGAFAILRRYLNHHPNYKHFHNLLAEIIQQSHLGQALDVATSGLFRKTRDISLLSFDEFQAITVYKTHFVMYVAPVLSAIYLAELDPDLYFDSVRLFRSFSVYRQAQNDMWDVFGHHVNVGKVSCDIANGQCTWITSMVLIHGSEKQKELLQENYGRAEISCRNVCYRIFEELEVLGKYVELKEDLVRSCAERISEVSHPGFARMINTLLEHYVVQEDFLL